MENLEALLRKEIRAAIIAHGVRAIESYHWGDIGNIHDLVEETILEIIDQEINKIKALND